MEIIKIERKILEKNDEIAEKNRNIFKHHNLLVINMVSSPGAGKTSILENTIKILKPEFNISVIEGDVQTELDAIRVAKYDVPVVQIVTNGACHLEAKLISDAINNMKFENTDLLFIENVGNLVCPAGYDLGEDLKTVVVSTTEGDDKPLKYPRMFLNSKILIINKIDLLPYINCNIDLLKKNALQINPYLEIYETSCTTGEGIDKWCERLRSMVQQKKQN